VSGHLRNPADAQRVTGLGFVHGYHVAFFWAAVLIASSLAVVIVFVNARKDDIPAEPGLAAAA
jgi:hypothetical protein